MREVPHAGPSPFALAHRAAVLLGLIAGAVFLYAYVSLAVRGRLGLRRERAAERQRRYARRFVRVATRFKGGLIKVGQVASLHIDVFPEEVTAELARLQDRVAPHPYAEIAGQVEAELGAPIAERFAAFEPDALAAASLGQVHRARAIDGRPLAVKVLYPGIERSVAIDLAMVRVALWLFDFIAIADLMQVHRELSRSLRGEMDYLREGRAAEEIARNLARDPRLRDRVRVPGIHWDLTTRRVLAMDFLDGVRFNDRAALSGLGVDLAEVAVCASRAFLRMMFLDGFFHCDPHPGNLLVDAEGRVGIVDFGMNQRIDPALTGAIRKNVLAALRRDSRLYAESLVEAGVVGPGDAEAVARIAELHFDPAYYNLTPAELSRLNLAEYLLELRRRLRPIRSFRLPEGLLMWSRAASLLYALLVERAPGIRPLDVVAPYAVEFLQGGEGVNSAPRAASKPPEPTAPVGRADAAGGGRGAGDTR